MRTALTLAAIALGVASLILSGGYVEDLLLQLREATIHSRLGHLQIYKAGQFASGGQRPFDYLIDDTAMIDRVAAGLPGVLAQARRLSFSGLIGNGRGELPVIGEGVQPGQEFLIGTALTMLSGRRLAEDDQYRVLVGEGLARALKLRVGDSVNLVLTTRDGAMNTLEFDVVGDGNATIGEGCSQSTLRELPAYSSIQAISSSKKSFDTSLSLYVPVVVTPTSCSIMS